MKPNEERTLSYAAAIGEALRHEMRKDRRVFLLGEDIGRYGGLFGVTKGLWEEFGDERVRDTPISESAIMGLALGAALMGLRPVPEIMFIDFLSTCFDYLNNQAAKARYMSGGQVEKLPLVIRTAGGGGILGAGQHSQSLEGLFTQIPGLKVVMPATPYDAKGLMTAALRDNNPVLFVEHKLLYEVEGPVPEEDYLVPLGLADIKREGSDVTVTATSLMVHKALAAAETLAEEGIAVEVIDLRTVSPLDVETIITSVRKTRHVVTVQEAVKSAGTNHRITSLIMEYAFECLDAPIKYVAAPDTVIPFSPPLEQYVLPDVQDIVAAAREAVAG